MLKYLYINLCANLIEYLFRTNFMKNLENRINLFAELGELFRDIHSNNLTSKYAEWIKVFNESILLSHQHNKWFTIESYKESLLNLGNELERQNLIKWLSEYEIKEKSSKKTVAIIMAGNIPLVGFHDFLSVSILNFNTILKLSSDDKFIFPQIINFLDNISSGFKKKIKLTGKKIINFDAVIATGGDNSNKYFEFYFKDYPKILRKNRHSLAVLNGLESPNDLKSLGDDIFNYFGLGCRNVSKVFIPHGYDLDKLFGALYEFKDVINHNKYVNNYDYNKAVYLMNEEKFLDNGFLILKEDKSLGSPIGCIFYEYYDELRDIIDYTERNQQNIQCIVSNGLVANSIKFGQSQKPKLNNYADNIDTINFLLKI